MNRNDMIETDGRLSALERNSKTMDAALGLLASTVANLSARVTANQAQALKPQGLPIEVERPYPKASPVCAPSVAPRPLLSDMRGYSTYGCTDCGNVVYTAIHPSQCCEGAGMVKVNVTLA